MSLFKKIMLGLGNALVAQSKAEEDKAKADLLFNRDLALKALDHDYRTKESAQGHTEKLAEIDATAGANAKSALLQGVITSRIHQQDRAGALQDSITLKGVDFANDAKMEQVRQKLGMGRDSFQSWLTIQRDEIRANGEVDRSVISPKGEVANYNKKGKLLTQTPVGTTVPPGRAGGTGNDSIASLLGDDGGAAAPAASPRRAAAPQKSLQQVYNEATPDTAPGLFDPATGKKKPFNIVMSDLNAGR